MSLDKLLAPLKRRVALMVSRAVVRLVDDSLKMQEVQIGLLAGEVASDVERFQEYGFTSVPLEGAEAVALAVGGSRAHLVVVATDDRRHRLSGLQDGEVALYNDEGSYIKLKRGMKIEIVGSAGVLIGAGDNAQALGDGLKTCLTKLIDELIPLCTSATTMGAVLAPGVQANLEALKTAIGLNAGDGEIISLIHKTAKQ